MISTVDDIELVALWNGADEYTVYFDGNGNYDNTSMEPMTVKYGEECILPVATFDKGKGFDCWGTTPDGSGNTYSTYVVYGDLVDRETGSIVLYALWNEYYDVIYYNGVTKQPIYRENMPHVFTVYGEKELPEIKLNGLRLKGWREADNVDGLLDDMIEYGPQSSYVNAGDRHLELFPVYDVVETGKRALVFYDPDRNFETFTYLVSKETEAVLMPKITEHDAHHEFAYWINQITAESKVPVVAENTWTAGEPLYLDFSGKILGRQVSRCI